MNTFQTQTDHSAYAKMMALIMTVCGVIVDGAFIVAFANSIKSMIAVGVAVAILWITISIYAIRTNNCFTIYFTGDRIKIMGVRRKQNYEVYDITASDLVITQTKRQKKNDTCNLKINDTIFNFYFVENSEELREYIKNNFPEE